jgi:hypothetical protein
MSDEFYFKHCGKIPKLTSTNYLQWASSMLDHFGACDNADIVLGTRERPRDRDAGARRAWEVEDSCARGAIKGACSSEMRAHIEKTITSAAMWQILEEQANSAIARKDE